MPRFTLRIEDTLGGFIIHVLDGDTEIHKCGWHGSYFDYKGQKYQIVTPYWNHGMDSFQVFQLTPVSDKY